MGRRERNREIREWARKEEGVRGRTRKREGRRFLKRGGAVRGGRGVNHERHERHEKGRRGEEE